MKTSTTLILLHSYHFEDITTAEAALHANKTKGCTSLFGAGVFWKSAPSINARDIRVSKFAWSDKDMASQWTSREKYVNTKYLVGYIA